MDLDSIDPDPVDESYPPDPPEDPMAVGLRQMAGQGTDIALLDKDGNILLTAPINSVPITSGRTVTFSDITVTLT